MDTQSGKITALYCRLAHYNSDMDKMAGKYQMEALTQYAADKHLENTHFYCDWGYSGIGPGRPEYRRLLQDVLAGKVANIVVLNLSRLGRDSTACWDLIAGVLPQRNIAFHSIQDVDKIEDTINTFTKIQEEFMKVSHP